MLRGIGGECSQRREGEEAEQESEEEARHLFSENGMASYVGAYGNSFVFI